MIKLTIQGSLAVLRVKESHFRTGNKIVRNKGSKRGKITGFSQRSRSRLLRMLFALDLDRCGGMHFITLTARHDFGHHQVRAWLKRLYRRIGRVLVVWRKEYQVRGVVHYHLIVVSRKWIDYKELAEIWRDVLEVDYYPQVKGVFVQKASPKLRAYLLKYVSKYDFKSKADAGAPGEAGGASASVLDVHAITGRQWGVENRDKMVYSPTLTMFYVPWFLRERFESYMIRMVERGYRVEVAYLYLDFDYKFVKRMILT